MNILERLLGLPQPEITAQSLKESVVEAAGPGPQPIINLNIAVQSDGQVSMLFHWVNDSKSVAELTARLLYRLNTGEYIPTFASLLNGYSERQAISSQFVESVFEFWNKELAREEEPVIKPRNALRANTE
jgi:hypothetical protein